LNLDPDEISLNAASPRQPSSSLSEIEISLNDDSLDVQA
jgi:hypothetical protein